MTKLTRAEKIEQARRRTRLDEVRHPAIVALRGKRLGPAFPRDEAAGPLSGMKGVPRRATKRPFWRRVVKRERDAVTASCLSCPWTTSGRHWRPVKRLLAAHTATKHDKAVA
jgi:hypothetical protein